MKSFKVVFYSCLVAFVLCFVAADVQAQCAMCRSSVASSHSEHNKLVRFGNGLNKGILYLAAIPYILGGTLGFLWYRSNRKKA